MADGAPVAVPGLFGTPTASATTSLLLGLSSARVARPRQRRMTRPSTVRWAGATVIALGLVAASCSSTPVGYGPGAEAAFVAGCAPGGDEPARTVCTCVYRRLRDQFTFEQYRDIDRQLEQGKGTVPDEIKQAVDACNRETRTNQSASSGP